MNRHLSPFHFLVLTLSLLALGGCGGKKRAPAVATGPDQTAPMTGARPIPQPVEPGPDVRQVEGEGIGGRDIGDGTSEGGPLADIHFALDQANLSDEARGILEKHALWLQNNRATRVKVEGHCDERGTAEYNLALGEKRARAAREYLVSLGVTGDRLTTVSFGKERPLDPGHDETAWARNRRAHFAVSR